LLAASSICWVTPKPIAFSITFTTALLLDNDVGMARNLLVGAFRNLNRFFSSYVGLESLCTFCARVVYHRAQILLVEDRCDEKNPDLCSPALCSPVLSLSNQSLRANETIRCG